MSVAEWRATTLVFDCCDIVSFVIVASPQSQHDTLLLRFCFFHSLQVSPENFDPISLAPDTFAVDLRITHSSDIKLFGSILRHFIHLKVQKQSTGELFSSFCRWSLTSSQ